MSKRVQIAVIREATLNAKPTDTHYLAEGGLRISRKDAVALKGTTLYYQEVVDLGQVTGGDFIPGRDIPVYTTDSEPVLAIQPHLLKLVEAYDVSKVPTGIVMQATGCVAKADTSLLMQNAVTSIIKAAESVPGESSVEVKSSSEFHPDGTPANVSVKVDITPEAPVKRKPGRPRKVIAEAPAPAPAPTPEVAEEIAQVKAFIEAAPIPDFEVAEEAKQDDESTFLIEPTGTPPTPAPAPKPEFSFEVDEDEAPAPPPLRNAAPASVDFEVEDDEPAAAPAVKEPEAPAMAVKTDDFADVEPGLFDE